MYLDNVLSVRSVEFILKLQNVALNNVLGLKWFIIHMFEYWDMVKHPTREGRFINSSFSDPT